jgi:MFS family permease
VDRLRRGAQRPPQLFASVGLVGVAVALTLLVTHDPTVASTPFLGAVWLVMNVMLALSDVAADALALDTVPDDARGRTQGFMLGGHHVGLEGLGGIALGAVVAAADLSAALWLQAAIAVLVAGVVWVLPVTRSEPPQRGQFFAMVLELFSRPRARWGLVVAAVVLAADVLTSAMSGQFWVQRLGWTPEAISQTLPPIVLGANLAAYAVAAIVVDRLGHVRAAAMGSAALGLCWLAFALVEPLWSVDAFMVAFVGAQALVTALMYVGLHATFMDLVDPRVRATHFVVFTVLLNLPRAAAPLVAAPALDALGWAGVWAACGLFQVAVAVLVRRL